MICRLWCKLGLRRPYDPDGVCICRAFSVGQDVLVGFQSGLRLVRAVDESFDGEVRVQITESANAATPLAADQGSQSKLFTSWARATDSSRSHISDRTDDSTTLGFAATGRARRQSKVVRPCLAVLSNPHLERLVHRAASHEQRWFQSADSHGEAGPI